MPSAKGKPTDPKLREEVVEDVKAKPNKDGSGKGKMAAWKAAQIGKEYEARGGDYENKPGSKDKPQKGAPVKKSSDEKAAESKSKSKTKDGDEEKNGGEEKKRGRPAGSKSTAKKPKKAPVPGERKSARQAGKEADGKEVPAKRKREGSEEAGTKKKGKKSA